jgi:glycosyltransferase involved in cell wall biosynthesis
VDRFHPDYLRESVGSVLRQTSPAWRLIIATEGGRTEPLRGALDAALDDRRVTVVLNEGRRLAGALNTAMRRADTDFVAILLGDDLWEPDAVEVLQRRITDGREADFLHSSRRYVDDQGRPLSGVVAGRDRVCLEDFSAGTPVKHLLCWRRELALSFGGLDESLDIGADDFDFPWTMAEHGARFAPVAECLYVYRDHRSAYRLTTHVPRRLQARQVARILRKHGLDDATVRRRVEEAERTYLRQALYASALHRSLRRVTGEDPQRGWRESYASR